MGILATIEDVISKNMTNQGATRENRRKGSIIERIFTHWVLPCAGWYPAADNATLKYKATLQERNEKECKARIEREKAEEEARKAEAIQIECRIRSGMTEMRLFTVSSTIGLFKNPVQEFR